MNDLFKKLFIVMCAVSVFLIVIFVWAIHSRTQALTELARSNQLVERYRDLDAEAARTNKELTRRNQFIEEGLSDLRELTSGSVRNIQSAINILAGVKSILEKMEDDSLLGNTTGAGGGAYNGTGNR